VPNIKFAFLSLLGKKVMVPRDKWLNRLSRRLQDNWPLRHSEDSPPSRLLSQQALLLASKLYGGAMALRAGLYKVGWLSANRLSCPVISIGNLSVGGTGKTPVTMYLADMLCRSGMRVVILSRGYKGRAETTGGIVSDGTSILLPPGVAGDEPFLMAAKMKNIPVLVGKSRVDTGRLAIDRFHPDVILLDDGFQHLKLKRDLNLVLLDGRTPLGTTHLLPAGDLREPVSALHRADAFVLTHTGNRAKNARNREVDRLVRGLPLRPLFRSRHVSYVYRLARHSCTSTGEFFLKRESGVDELPPAGRTLAFSGIARNQDFRDTAVSKGFRLAGFEAFPDHHWYSDADVKRLLGRAREIDAAHLVTTEKDAARMTAHIPDLPLDLYVIGIRISFGADSQGVADFIFDRLQ